MNVRWIAYLVPRHRSSVGLRWPSERIAALHRWPIHLRMGQRCALRGPPPAARCLRHLIGDATPESSRKPSSVNRSGQAAPIALAQRLLVGLTERGQRQGLHEVHGLGGAHGTFCVTHELAKFFRADSYVRPYDDDGFDSFTP